MKDKKSLKTNLIFAGVLLLVAAVWGLYQYAKPPGTQAIITYGGGQTLTVSLSKDARYDLESSYLTVHLEVKNGAIAFVDAPCPDHICENTGWLSKDGQSASCLPAPATVMVLEGE